MNPTEGRLSWKPASASLSNVDCRKVLLLRLAQAFPTLDAFEQHGFLRTNLFEVYSCELGHLKQFAFQTLEQKEIMLKKRKKIIKFWGEVFRGQRLANDGQLLSREKRR